MNAGGNTVLITGGASGIGFAFAERFMKAENTVIVCGRREEKLAEAKELLPGIHTRVCDVTLETERKALFDWATREFPAINTLVNNAGIQQTVDLLSVQKDWTHYQQEIATNLNAPIHLTTLFLPHLLRQERAAIINVSSGLAIAPAVWAPIYSATKAALHSFTISLRIQLAKTNVRVVEVLPPAVNTDLGGAGMHTFGAPLNEFADAVFAKILAGELEIGYGMTEDRVKATSALTEAAKQMWLGYLDRNPNFS